MRTLLLALFVIAAPMMVRAEEAVTGPAAPAEVDAALRARVSKFYELFRAARFRLAEDLLTEESKEAYYVAQKRRIYGHTIKSIEWGDNFEFAKVFVTVQQLQPALGSRPLPVPLVGIWRKVDGDWFLDIAKRQGEACQMSPSGMMCFDQELGENRDTAASAPIDIENLVSMVAISAEELVLPAKTDTTYERVVTITNRAKGMLTLEPAVVAVPPNVRFTVDMMKIPQGGEAHVTIFVDPAEKPVYGGKYSVAFTVVPLFRRVGVSLRFTENASELTPAAPAAPADPAAAETPAAATAPK